MPDRRNEQKVDTKVLAPISYAGASRISPWPDRIKNGWTRARGRRSTPRILNEYDKQVYAGLLSSWKRFWKTRAPHQRHPGAALQFYAELRESTNRELSRQPEVYGHVSAAAYLVSLTDRLYAADLNVFESWWRAYIVQRLRDAASDRPFEGLVEVGCGSGINLFQAYIHLGLAGVAGCDCSPNAIRFLRRVTDDLGVPARLRAGDYLDVSLINGLASTFSSWALVSVHAIEQSQRLAVDWIASLVRSPHPPRIVLHFEPVIWPDRTAFGHDCARYAELNAYNSDLLKVLRTAERQGLIRILRTEKRAIGHSAFNPTTLLMWEPSQLARSSA